MTGFSALTLPPLLSRAVEVLGFTAMTPVQEHALPPLLEGKDVIAQARTGSGKTVAFGLGLLARVDVDVSIIQGLVLCPTRELAVQVAAELRRLARFIPNLRIVTLVGGVPVRTQTPQLQNVPHVVVGTPGRVLDHLTRETIDLRDLRVLVLDEADRMLDMGFKEAIDDVVGQTFRKGTGPVSRQTLLFSATWPDEIRALSASLQRDPIVVTVDTQKPTEVDERLYEVNPDDKLDALAALLLEHRPSSALVFCTTRNDVRDVTADLARRGFSALALHGELEQRERDEVLLRFAHGSCSVLVATDVAARGLDIQGLAAVISYELPPDPDLHVHRTGRTGRAGQSGLSLVLVAARERTRLVAIEERRGPMTKATLPPLRGALTDALSTTKPPPPAMVTLCIDGGKDDKLRKGDVLGALTGDVGLDGDDVGKIEIGSRSSWVSVKRAKADAALAGLKQKKIKGKTFRVRAL